MIKKLNTLKYILLLMLLFSSMAVYAIDYNIAITQDGSQNHDDIVISPTTIDIPISAVGYQDIYAFSISMDYEPSSITVESIELGDIFADYGNAVLVNNIDNEAGKVDFMQTLLSVDSGVSNDGTLCTLRITFKSGEYDSITDLGLDVQIANSTPEYMTTIVPQFKVIVGATTQESEPTPTLAPVATATVGIVTPDPSSETSQEFEAAEDEDIDTIMAEIIEAETTPEPTATTTQANDSIATNATTITNDNTKVEDKGTTKLISTILLVVLVVLVLFLVGVIVVRESKGKRIDKKEEIDT